jgi:recombination protein RecT
MTNLANQTKQTPATLKSMLANDSVKNRFQELLGKKSAGFISSIINVTQSNKLLAKAEPKSIIASAVVAASLDLPIDKNLGFSWIVPYGNQAQFQMGYKGYTQLALRTGQYHKLNVIEVYENQFKSFNAMTEELDADFTIDGQGNVVGYACYFRLVNGFEKTTYWTIEKVKAHGKRYSKSFNNGPWSTDFDEMAKKTVLKNTLSKWGIMSIEMQKATISDQAVIHETEDGDQVDYVDNYDEAEIVEEQQKTKTEQQIKGIVDELDKNAEKTDKKPVKDKGSEPDKLTFKDEDDARDFFQKEYGLIPENVEGKKLYSAAKSLNIEIVIKPKDGQLL